jgi:adenylate cyclase
MTKVMASATSSQRTNAGVKGVPRSSVRDTVRMARGCSTTRARVRNRRVYDLRVSGAPTPSELFRATMSGGEEDALRMRRFLRRVPTGPRCKSCNAPFGMPGSLLSRAMGRTPWSKNPRFCTQCYTFLKTTGIDGAEVEVSLLFADVRGSTGLAERLGPSEFTSRINRFYRVAGGAILATDGLVDKFMGDGVVGLYIPGLSGLTHPAQAVDAARRIAATSDDAEHGGLPIGVGVHTGVAFVGAVGSSGEVDDFTALGDAVNAAARLGSEAAAGEVLVSLATAAAAGLDAEPLERRRLTLKGRTEPMDVVVLGAAKHAHVG